MMSGLIPGHNLRMISTLIFRPLVEYLNVLWYSDGGQVWDEHKREYFQLKAILFVIVSDSPATRNLSGQRKKVGCGCPHCFRKTIVYMRHRCYNPMKHQFWSMKDQFNGNTEKRHPPPHLTGHEVYKMVKDVHVSLISGRGLAKVLKKMTCVRSNQFLGSYCIGKT
jgi:hypothetical protein